MAKLIKFPKEHKIPANWKWVKLGNYISTKTGYPFDSKRFSKKSEGLKGLIRIRDIVRGYTETFTDEECTEDYIIHKGDMLIGMDGEFNIAKWNSSDAFLNQRVCLIKSNSQNLLDDFLFYYLPYPLESINETTPSITVKHLSTKTLEQIPFPLPPLAEQERIVNKLDNYISKLDEAKEKLEKVVDTYEFRKYVILNKAFKGELTKNWREKNKFELDDDIKKKAITKDSMLPDEYLYEIPENWRWVRLGEINIKVIDGDRGKNYPKKKKEFFSEGYCIFLNAKNVTKDGFKFDNLEYITKDKDELLRSGRLNRGDIVMTTRGTIGNIALYDDSIIYDKLRINSGMVIFRSEFEIVKKYIIYLWQSILIKNQINILTTGTAQPQLPIKDLKKIHFPLPPLEEQKEIVKFLDSILSKGKKVKEIERIGNLRENLLTRAFAGLLGTNNPNEENPM